MDTNYLSKFYCFSVGIDSGSYSNTLTLHHKWGSWFDKTLKYRMYKSGGKYRASPAYEEVYNRVLMHFRLKPYGATAQLFQALSQQDIDKIVEVGLKYKLTLLESSGYDYKIREYIPHVKKVLELLED